MSWFPSGHKVSPETRQKISLALKGKKPGDFKPKLSILCNCGCGLLTRKGRQYINGHNNRGKHYLNKGTIHSSEHRKHISEGGLKGWIEKRTRLPLGSKKHDAGGYVLIRISPKGWKKEHILIMEEHIGHKLAFGEIVHHINGIRTDNRIENLFLCKGQKEHARIENSCKILIKQLFRSGIFHFNKETLCYELGHLQTNFLEQND